MKHTKKMMLVPFTQNVEKLNNSNENNTSYENFDDILDLSIDDDQKIKLYLNAFTKYRDKYHSSKIDRIDIKAIKELTEKFNEYIEKKVESDSETFLESPTKTLKKIKLDYGDESYIEKTSKTEEEEKYNPHYNRFFSKSAQQQYLPYLHDYSLLNDSTFPMTETTFIEPENSKNTASVTSQSASKEPARINNTKSDDKRNSFSFSSALIRNTPEKLISKATQPQKNNQNLNTQQLTDRRKSNVYNASASTISINKNSNLNTRQQNDSRQRSARNTNTVDYNIDNLLTKTFLNLPPTPEKSKKAIEKKNTKK